MAQKKALGDCFRWAYLYILRHPGAVLYQGQVKAPYRGAPEEHYDHAWVVDGGIVKDWQTMVAGLGGQYRGKGWPASTWERVWRPQDVRAYSIEQAAMELSKFGHYGPWR